mgnify:CR=1 FL=1
MIHLIDNYYLTADNNSYTVGTARKKPDSRVILVGTRYYLSLARAVSETAEIALRDRIAAGKIPTLHVAVVAVSITHLTRPTTSRV